MGERQRMETDIGQHLAPSFAFHYPLRAFASQKEHICPFSYLVLKAVNGLLSGPKQSALFLKLLNR